ncbi:hypothetical protein [Caloramator australicus]|uniref:hypothetical protein n=1 Tax=Caloramator australicus TaxID=515264 RepID=UPI0002DCE921|nr:hypothetical protein [Caloramator australicus]
MKRILYLISLFIVLLLLSSNSASAAVTSKYPIVKFSSNVKDVYYIGDKIIFTVNSSNFPGKVEYRVQIKNLSTGKITELWNSKNGYPTRYNTKGQVLGRNNFKVPTTVSEAGIYNITVYVKRAGLALNKAKNSKLGYDSIVVSKTFEVKNPIKILDKEGAVIGSEIVEQNEMINNVLKITAKDVTIKNAFIYGDVYVLADNVTLNNVHISGNLILNPPSEGGFNLDNVFAENVNIVSNKSNEISLKHLITRALKVDSGNVNKLVVTDESQISSTKINRNMTLEVQSGSFGAIFVEGKANATIELNLVGVFDKPIIPKGNVVINNLNTEINKLVDVHVYESASVILNGNFREVYIKKPAYLNLAENSKVNLIKTYDDAEIYQNDNTRIDFLINADNSKYVLVDGKQNVGNYSGFVRFTVGKELLPSNELIKKAAKVDVYYYNIIARTNSNNYTIKPVLVFRLLREDGSYIPIKFGGYIYFYNDGVVEKIQRYVTNSVFTIGVNKEDGTIALRGGKYRIIIPSEDGNWYEVSFETKKVEGYNQAKSEIVLVDEKPFKLARWKRNVTSSTSYFTLGTTLKDLIKIQGQPKSGSYQDTNNRFYIYKYSSSIKTKNGNNYVESTVYLDNIDGQFVVTGWENWGNLKVSLGVKDPNAKPVTFGSTLQDFVKANGTPFKIYVDSDTIYVNGDEIAFYLGKLTTFRTYQNLKLEIGKKDPNAPAINLESKRQDVIKAMGTPTKVSFGDDSYTLEHWEYGESYITFDRTTGKVKKWVNYGNLKVSLGEKLNDAPAIMLGSSYLDVIKAEGTPYYMSQNDDGSMYWAYKITQYTSDSFTFDKNGNLIEFTTSGTIKVFIKIGETIYDNIKVGMTRDEIINILGQPSYQTDRNISYGDLSFTLDSNGKVTFIRQGSR